MSTILPLIASATVGGIIGYSTNWVAIKMLFRPLEEKRILGLRVPFTPGVIPRQRKALGKSIGTTVNDYLLTKDALIEVANKHIFITEIESLVDNFISNIDNDKSVKDMLLGFNIDTSQLKCKLTDVIAKPSNSNLIKNGIFSSISELSKNISSKTLGEILANDDLLTIDKYTDKIEKYIESIIYKKLEFAESNNLSLRELVSDEVLEFIKQSLQYNAPNMLLWVSNQLESEEVLGMIEQYINDFLSGNFLGSILGGILPPATLSKMIGDKAKEKLSQPQTLIFVQDKLDILCNNISNKEIRELLPSDFSLAVPKISQVLAKEISSLISSSLAGAKEKYGSYSLKELGFKFNINIEQKIHENLFKIVNNYINSKENIYKIVDTLVNFVYSIPVKSLLNSFALNNASKIAKSVQNIIIAFIKNHGDNLLKLVNVTEMVENQIDKLELLQVEEIVLSVMNNQLKSITNFGLLLGALLGLFMPILNSWISTF